MEKPKYFNDNLNLAKKRDSIKRKKLLCEPKHIDIKIIIKT